METQFYTQYLRPPHVNYEINSGENIVEEAGYISAQARIESLINAGSRLVESRREQFDFPDGEIPEDYDDPTRSTGFDLSDQFKGELQAEATVKKLKNQKKEAENAENTDPNSKVPVKNSANPEPSNKGGQLASGEGQ